MRRLAYAARNVLSNPRSMYVIGLVDGALVLAMIVWAVA